MSDEKADACISMSDEKAKLIRAEHYIEDLICQLKEKEAEKAHYLKENDFLKEALRRIIGS